ncbi:MAG: hypothetical protein ACREDE_07095, partial [Thermoplasmata archaeon]
VPGLSRDQLQPPNVLAVNSPNHITQAVYQDGVWAREHLNASGRVWGDMLVYDVYAGIGGLVMPFDTYRVFNSTSLTANNSLPTKTGDYVVTDIYDTTLAADFYGSRATEPLGPLQPAQIQKFNNPAYFSVVFHDSVFTVYQVTHVPRFYSLDFIETGLPAGTTWSVTIGSSTSANTSSSVAPVTNSYTVLNGTYIFTVSAVSGFTASPSSGAVTVSGAARAVTIAFS